MCLPYSVPAIGPTLPAFERPASPLVSPPELHSPAMTCHACGAQLSSTARFCHKCGAAVATAGVTGWRAGLPWGLAGAALGALVTVLAMRGAGGRGQEEREKVAPAPGTRLQAPDISQKH